MVGKKLHLETMPQLPYISWGVVSYFNNLNISFGLTDS